MQEPGPTRDSRRALLYELEVSRRRRVILIEELRCARSELAQSRALLAFAPIGCLTLDARGRVHEANRTACAMLGTHCPKLLGERLAMHVAPDSLAALRQHQKAVFSGESKQTVELTMRRADGSPFTVEMQSIVTTNGTEGRKHCRTAFLDVTQRKHAEQELRHLLGALEKRVAERTTGLERSVREARESRAQLDSIIRSAQDAIITIDSGRHIILFNEAAERIFGWPAERIIGWPIALLVPKPLRITYRRILRQSLHDTGLHPPNIFEGVHGLRADGTEFPTSTSLSHVKIGGATYSTLIVRDITESMRTANALRQSEQALADFFAEAPIGLMWVNAEGRVTRVNRAKLDLLGRTEQEVLDHPVTDFHADPPAITALLACLARGETVRNQRARIPCGDGSMRHVLIDANGLWSHGRLVHTRWFVRDITRRLALEKEVLLIAESEQQRIGHDLHDDLCQQLAGIEFLTQTLSGELQPVCRKAAAAARKVAELLRQAVTHARELSHGLAPTIHFGSEGLAIALKDLAARTRTLYRRQCRFSSKGSPRIQNPAVSLHLYRIAQEAISNAVRHGKANRIDIRLAAKGRTLVLAVKDNGIGLPPAPHPSPGMGLRVMQYRSGIINGSLIIQRQPRGGTAVVCAVEDALPPPEKKPYEEKARH